MLGMKVGEMLLHGSMAAALNSLSTLENEGQSFALLSQSIIQPHKEKK